MVHYFTNREIARKLDINLARWKRWSRSFLPPDPLGGLQSGYARQYIFKDLFKVFLGGHLLSHLKLSVPETQQVLTDLSPLLKKKGFLDLNGSIELDVKNITRRAPCRIYLRRLPLSSGKKGPSFGYLIRETLTSHFTPTAVGRQVTEIVDEAIINCDIADGSAFLHDPEVHMINLGVLMVQLVERLTVP